MQNNVLMPVLFTGHGSPMNAIGENRARAGWQALGKTLPRPRVIVAISAHWATRGLKVRTAPDVPQINDMYGFPPALDAIRYQPPGDPAAAQRALSLLGGQAAADNAWGIDHGVWTVLCNLFPAADIPVVMVSTDVTAGPEAQLAVGQKLAAMRREGALLLASGNVVHNLRAVDWDNPGGAPWADAFDAAIRDAIVAGRAEAPVRYADLPHARQAVPTPEHYNPLLAALGAVQPADQVTVLNDYRELGSMSMTSYLWAAQG